MTRAKDISKIVTDADLSGTLDVAGELQVGVDGTTAGLIRLMDSGSVTEEATISTDANGGLIFGGNSGPGELIFKTSSGTERVRITSAGNVGIGTTDPSSTLVVGGNATTTAKPTVAITDTTSGATLSMRGQSPKIAFDITSSGVPKILMDNAGLEFKTGTLDAEGDVDFKITSGGYLEATSGSQVRLTLGSEGTAGSNTANWIRGNGTSLGFNSASGGYQWEIGGGEKMRITSAGDLLVGKTSSTSSTVGCELNTEGRAMFTRDAGLALIVNRNTDDGDIVQFRKDNIVVGSIGADTDDLIIGTGDTGFRFRDAGDDILPFNMSTGVDRDNAMDLGDGGARFDDIYATNSTIQTSDQNEKNTITDSDLGIDFIKRLTPKSYIFNGKTRTHYGLIAQDVETVLTDINKPTSGFAGFIKSDISEEQDGSEYRYGLRYGEFVAPLIQAVKDQQATIDALTARITALENGE